MKYLTGNMLKHAKNFEVMLVTTNGFVKTNGECVMGRGIANQVAKRIPNAPKLLGDSIKKNGNIVQCFFKNDKIELWSFPVKPAYGKEENLVAHMKGKIHGRVPGWAVKAELPLIEKSLQQLVARVERIGKKKILALPFGCGAGELSWKNSVESLAKKYLDDRFTICSFNQSDFEK